MKFSRAFKIVLSLIMLPIFLSGCMSTTHLKDLVIVEGLAIDLNEGEYEVSVQTLNINSSAGSQDIKGNMTTNSSERGGSVTEAISALSRQLSGRLFFGQNKLVIIGNAVAEQGLDEHIDYFLRSSDSRADVAVCLSDSSARSIIESEEKDSTVPCENMLSVVKNGEENGLSQMITTSEIINLYNDKTSDFYLPTVERKNEKSPISISGIALFDDDRLARRLSEKEVIGFTMMNNKTRALVLQAEDEALGKIDITLSKIKCTRRLKRENNGFCLSADISADMIIDSIERGSTVGVSVRDSQRIIGLISSLVSAYAEAAFDACRMSNSDALRVGEQLAMEYPGDYAVLSEDWHNNFKDFRIEVNPSIKLKKISNNTQIE